MDLSKLVLNCSNFKSLNWPEIFQASLKLIELTPFFRSIIALTVLVKNVPKTMSSWISQILPPVWSTMTSSADKYVKNVVNDTGDEEEIVDSDGEVLGKNL